ncbi:unnamed protein product [Prorocentrum cordatum]|uniref:PDZ domain-containing protein n=1 Tax=Prorocentrum cordatum TaxID=2364126 RepID=A0ABN9VRW3_9DINO|nr:unnamed protein product [Polarella glacialis]
MTRYRGASEGNPNYSPKRQSWSGPESWQSSAKLDDDVWNGFSREWEGEHGESYSIDSPKSSRQWSCTRWSKDGHSKVFTLAPDKASGRLWWGISGAFYCEVGAEASDHTTLSWFRPGFWKPSFVWWAKDNSQGVASRRAHESSRKVALQDSSQGISCRRADTSTSEGASRYPPQDTAAPPAGKSAGSAARQDAFRSVATRWARRPKSRDAAQVGAPCWQPVEKIGDPPWPRRRRRRPGARVGPRRRHRGREPRGGERALRGGGRGRSRRGRRRGAPGPGPARKQLTEGRLACRGRSVSEGSGEPRAPADEPGDLELPGLRALAAGWMPGVVGCLAPMPSVLAVRQGHASSGDETRQGAQQPLQGAGEAESTRPRAAAISSAAQWLNRADPCAEEEEGARAESAGPEVEQGTAQWPAQSFVASSEEPRVGASIDAPGRDLVSQDSLVSSVALQSWSSSGASAHDLVPRHSLVSSEAAQAGTSVETSRRDPLWQPSRKGTHEFTIRLDKRSYGVSFGARIDWMDDATLQLESITKQGLIRNWNLTNPEEPIKTADRIVEVNGCRGCASRLMAELMKQQMLNIVLRRVHGGGL